MASFNKIMIVGFLGRDPELRYSPQGTAVCNFSIATTEKRKDRNGDGDQEDVTTWFKVTAFGRQAELAHEYLKKGNPCFVDGRLRQEQYTDREGNTRYSLEVTASDIQFLGSRSDGQSSPHDAAMDGQRPESGQKQQGNNRQGSKKPVDSDDDDSIPF